MSASGGLPMIGRIPFHGQDARATSEGSSSFRIGSKNIVGVDAFTRRLMVINQLCGQFQGRTDGKAPWRIHWLRVE